MHARTHARTDGRAYVRTYMRMYVYMYMYMYMYMYIHIYTYLYKDLMSGFTLSEARPSASLSMTVNAIKASDYNKLRIVIDARATDAERKEAERAKAMAKKKEVNKNMAITINFGDNSIRITTRGLQHSTV